MLGIYAGATFDDLVAAVVSYNAELNKSHRISERRPKRICIVCSSGKEKCGFKAYASLNVENAGIQITQFEPHTCKEPCKRARQVRTKVLAAVVPGIRDIVPTRDTNGEIAKEIREMVRKQTGVELTKSQLNKIKAERKRKYEAEQKAEKIVAGSIPPQIVAPPPPPIVASQVVAAAPTITSAPLLQPPTPPVPTPVATPVQAAQQLPPGADQLLVHPIPQVMPPIVLPATNEAKRQKMMKEEGTTIALPEKEYDPMMETWEARGVCVDVVRPLKSAELASCLAAYLVSYDTKMLASCRKIEMCLATVFAEGFISGAVFAEAIADEGDEMVKMIMQKLKDIDNIGAQVGIKVRLRSFLLQSSALTPHPINCIGR